MKKIILLSIAGIALVGCEDKTAAQYSQLSSLEQYAIRHDLTEQESKELKELGLEVYIEREQKIKELQNKLWE